jgi:hypothetical protein
MALPHIFAYLGRTLHLTKLVSFAPEEDQLFIKTGIFHEVHIETMSKTYHDGALKYAKDIQDIDNRVRAGQLDLYKAQVEVGYRTQKFNREFGLEKRLAQAS